MIRLSLFSGLLYSSRLEVNETPGLEPGPEARGEAWEDPDPFALRRIYAPLLLLSAGLVAYAQLRSSPARALAAEGSEEELASEASSQTPRQDEAKSSSEAVTPCKEQAPDTPNTASTPSTSSTCSPQKGKPIAPPKGLGKGAKGASKGPPGPGVAPKGKAGPKGKGPPFKGGFARQGSEDGDPDGRVANPFGARRIRWKTISEQCGTVFHGLDSQGSFTEARKMLHEVLVSSAIVQPTARNAAFVPKSSGVCLLDRNRAQQLAIAFRRSPLPLQKLCSALQTLDFSVPLSEEEIEGLIKAWPTDTDFRQVAEHMGPSEELRDVEQCIRQVAAVPRSEARLKLLRLSRSLDSLTMIFDRLAVLQTACDELMKSEKLQVLLQEALHLGNYINGDAGAGFSLDAFIQLRSLKGVGGATPLHCLCAGCAQEDTTFCSTLHAELSTVREAANLSLRSLSEMLQRIQEDVQSAADELIDHSTHYDSSPAIVELEETPTAAIQPLGRGQRPGQGGNGNPPFGIPPLHLQMIRAEALSVTFEQSDEEETSASDGRSVSGDDEPGSPTRRAASECGEPSPRGRSPGTPPLAPRADRSPGPQWPQGSPQSSASPEMSPETLSERSVAVSAYGQQRLPLRFMPPGHTPTAAADANRPSMPTLRLPQAETMEMRPDGLCTPRGTARRAVGSMIREAPPRPSPRSPRTPGSPLTARATRLFGEDATRLYLEGWPVPTPRLPGPPTARSEGRGLKSARSAAASPGPAGAADSCKVFSLFIRNATVKLTGDASSLALNRTERLMGTSAVNCTCGYATPASKFVGSQCNCSADDEGLVHNVTRSQSQLEGPDSSSSSAASSPRRRRNARAQLHGLVARGRILLQRASSELDDMSATIARCERYFGGLSADRKDGGGIPLLCATVDVLAAFQQAWEEVHRDERWARFLPLTTVRTTSRSEASTSRRRRFTPRRSLP